MTEPGSNMTLGIIAGGGVFPFTVAGNARAAGGDDGPDYSDRKSVV